MNAVQDGEIESLISCEICQKELDDPVILPCLNSVCSTHITSNDSFYKCNICNRFHQIPDQGFTKDRKASKLIIIKNRKTETKPEIKIEDYIRMDQINFGKTNSKAKSDCQELENLLEHNTNLMLNSHDYINSYFEKIIKEVDLHKEVSLSLISQNHERILGLISKQKSLCFENSSTQVDSFKSFIENSKNKLKTWRDELKVPDFDYRDKWQDISEEARELLNELRQHNEKFQDDLVLNRQYKFKPIKFDKNNFGDFEIVEKEKPILDSISELNTINNDDDE